MLSYATFDDNDCVDFSAFTRLNMICRSLVKPLDGLRHLLRAKWLGEAFWRRADRHRETFEAEQVRCPEPGRLPAQPLPRGTFPPALCSALCSRGPGQPAPPSFVPLPPTPARARSLFAEPSLV